MKIIKKIGITGVALVVSGMIMLSFLSTKKATATTSSNIKYSLKSDYLVYKVYYTGLGYCPLASKNDGTTSSILWGFPTCD